MKSFDELPDAETKYLVNDSPNSNGNGSFGGRVDVYRKQRQPSPRDLVNSYESTAYACANLNSQKVASAVLRLYVKGKPEGAKWYQPKPVSAVQALHLRKNKQFKIANQYDLDELTDHPILDLLANPNESLDEYSLLFQTNLFQEIVGTAYWKIERNRLRPTKVYPLQSQFMFPVRDGFGQVEYYRYGFGNQIQEFQPQEIISFLSFNPNDVYCGLSPLRASWEIQNINNKLMAKQAAVLDNQARPDAILSPKGDGGLMGDVERERLEERFIQKFSRSGESGVLVLDEEMNLFPLSFNPKDLSILEFLKWGKTEICNAFQVPPAMLDKDSTVANLESYQKQHADDAITPRLRSLESRLNKFLVPLFDTSGKMFLAFDDPSQPNKEAQQRILVGYKNANVITANEVRYELGYNGHPEGDSLIPYQPGLERPDSEAAIGEDVAEPEAEMAATVEPQPATASEQEPQPTAATSTEQPVQDQALNGAQISSLLEIISLASTGGIPIASARGILAASFPGLSQDRLDSILSPLEGFKPAQPETPATPQGAPQQPPEPKDYQSDQSQEQAPQDATEPSAKEEPKSKALESDQEWVPPPEGQKLHSPLLKAFNRLQKKLRNQGLTKGIPERFHESDQWAKDLAKDAEEPLSDYMREGADELCERIDISPSVFEVSNPKVKQAIKEASLAFAQSTLESTTQQVNQALKSFREHLDESLSEGERLTDLQERIGEIFTGLTQKRLFDIAASEASRAHHLGQRIAGIESGVVKGWRWLLSDDACPKCQAFANKEIGLKESFGEDPSASNPKYKDVPFPPLHVSCRCSCIELLEGID